MRSSCMSAVESTRRCCCTIVTCRALFRHTSAGTVGAGRRVDPDPHPGRGFGRRGGGRRSGISRGGGGRGLPGYPTGASGGTSRYWRANRAIDWNAGAATTPPQIVVGSSTVTRMTSSGRDAGTNPTKLATYFEVE